MFCHACGAKNDDNATFCGSCGTNLKADSVSPPAPMAGAPAGGASAKIMGAFQDAIALVTNPKGFMTSRADVAPPLESTIINYVAILAAIPFLFTLIGYLIFHHTLSPYTYAVVSAILQYVFALVTVVVVAYALFTLAPSFGTVANLNRSAKMVSYVYTPSFLIAILDIYPRLGDVFTILAFLYGLYLLWVGLPIVMKTPEAKRLTYVIATFVVSVVVYIILALIVVAITHAFNHTTTLGINLPTDGYSVIKALVATLI